MAIKAINYKFQQADSVSISSYNSTKANVGNLIKFYTGPNPEDKFVGPSKIGMARPMEQSVAIPGIFPTVITYSSTIDWVFLADGAAAAATRRIILYEFNKNTSEFTWRGFVTINYPAGATGNKTIRAQDITYDLYTTGTVSVSGTAVTGSGTAWQSSKLAVGSRIGFGSNVPSEITTWYEITTIGSDTSITIDASISQTNVPYVIEDLRAVQVITNATATNGGLFLVKGLRYELFSAAGGSVSAGATDESARACYWLADAATVTNTIGYGIGVDQKSSWTSQDCYVLNANAVATAKIFKYNLRSTLTLIAGRATDAFLLGTGAVVVTGNISPNGSMIIATANHGPGNNAKSLYWVTASRVYRTDLATVTNNSVNFVTDAMIEVPPGSASTYAATGTFSNIIYDNIIDKFIIMNTGAASARSYVTEYNTTSNQFNHIFLTDTKQLDQSLATSDSPAHPTINASTFSGYSKNGILYMIRQSTLATLNQLYSLPVGAQQNYAITTNNLLISPKFNISDATKLYELNVNNIKKLGTDTFATPTEGFKVYYRTTGIDDNTGLWTALNDASNLDGVGGTEIQFAIGFRVLGNTCIPARIISLSLIYEDGTTDSRYTPSVGKSSVINRIFAYRQNSLFVGNIPVLRIRLYNADTGVLVLDDNTTDQTLGTFQYSTDGTTWNAWNVSENTIGNYIRYTAASLPNGIKIRVLLTQ
jgi:hypothetical protein